ncbi:MAG: hypothetical protein ACYDHY_17440 [Acidiferrobacterales bacterium]
MAYYKILTGMNWHGPDGPDGAEQVRAEPGEVRDDVPASSVPWLLEQGHIEAASGPAPVAEPVLAAVEALLHPESVAPVPDVRGL